MIGAAVTFALLGLALGLGLAISRRAFVREGSALVETIEALLPGTQCAQCGFPGCRPYAEAVASANAEINRCPPGGGETIAALADLLGEAAVPLARDVPAFTPSQVAVIDETQCIGCALCLEACPVDAIVGAPRWMHTVIVRECTGCELCVEPCPVDCIRLERVPVLTR